MPSCPPGNLLINFKRVDFLEGLTTDGISQSQKRTQHPNFKNPGHLFNPKKVMIKKIPSNQTSNQFNDCWNRSQLNFTQYFSALLSALRVSNPPDDFQQRRALAVH
jgi:hypothetical protein